jgi:hypothetical protein
VLYTYRERGEMVASKSTTEQIVKILLKYVDRKTAIKLARDLHNHVRGNQSVVDTFGRIVEYLHGEEH